MYKTIFFDLDGTLTDPGIGITNSVMHALEKWNIKVNDRSELYKFIGPPLLDSFQKYYGFTQGESIEALIYYREYFATKGIYENEVYPGIPELLEELKKTRANLYVVTSKPEEFSIEILRHFKLLKYFDGVYGATMDEKRSEKSEVIRYALDSTDNAILFDTIMVGDREYDILGAKACGIASLGVTYGYGSPKEIEESKPTYIANSVTEVKYTLL